MMSALINIYFALFLSFLNVSAASTAIVRELHVQLLIRFRKIETTL